MEYYNLFIYQEKHLVGDTIANIAQTVHRESLRYDEIREVMKIFPFNYYLLIIIKTNISTI